MTKCCLAVLNVQQEPSIIFFFTLQKNEAKKARNEISQKVKRLGGACSEKLESCLQDLRIKRQAYHSQSFVGNHIHKMLEVGNCNCAFFEVNVARDLIVFLSDSQCRAPEQYWCEGCQRFHAIFDS